jgi:uncharacterized protein (TIGR00369 family)
MDRDALDFGVAPTEAVAALTGREFLQRIIDGTLPNAPICRALTFRLVEVGDGFAAFEGEPGTHLLNPLGTVHGGWALTLIDSAAGCAGMSVLGPGVGYTTVETKANFSRPIVADAGTVRCEGRVLSRGRRIISCETTVRDDAHRLLAHGTSTLLVLESGPLPRTPLVDNSPVNTLS